MGGYGMLAIVSYDSLSAAATTDWVHSDHLGGLVQIISATGTQVTLGSRAYSLPQAPGQHRTLDDLYYNRYRDYDPTLGRYIQADPIGLDGGPSPYNYAMNNPLRYTDPTGENPVTAGRFAVRAGRTVGAGLTVWCRANIALCMRTIGPTAIRVSRVCREIASAVAGGGGGGRCDELNKAVKQAKKRVASLGKCRIGMGRWALEVRKRAWLELAQARARRDVICWGGGDQGHQQAQAAAWQNAGNCGAMM